jgi:hypothetical protein
MLIHSILSSQRISSLVFHHYLLYYIFSLFTFRFSLLTFHFSLFTFHFSLFTFHFLLFPFHFSLFTLHFSLLTSHFSLLTSHFSPLTFHFSLFTSHFSLLTSLFTFHFCFPLFIFQAKLYSLKDHLRHMTRKVEAFHAALSSIAADDNAMALMNLSSNSHVERLGYYDYDN